MIKTKGIIAVGVILLFMGLALSPVSARTTIKERFEVGTLGNLASVHLSENDLTTMENFLPSLFDRIQGATSYSEIINTLQGMMKDYGRHPVLVLLLKFVIKAMNFNYNINQLRPVRKTAFIMSLGFTNKILSPGKNKINAAKPFTPWYYTGKSNIVLNSRTIIIDPHPFSIRMLTGRQIGVMSNFIGLYIHMSGSLSDKAKTFFFGVAGTIRGFDLSPIHN
jgi:hypothetical protein